MTCKLLYLTRCTASTSSCWGQPVRSEAGRSRERCGKKPIHRVWDIVGVLAAPMIFLLFSFEDAKAYRIGRESGQPELAFVGAY